MKSLFGLMAGTCMVCALFLTIGCQQKAQEAKESAPKAAHAGPESKPAPAAAPAPVAKAAEVVEKVAATEKSGEALFNEYCAMCHANGGNIINPKKTLSKAHREEHKVNSVEGIVNNIRNPGPGMAKYDEETIPNADAKLIAEYILKTFN